MNSSNSADCKGACASSRHLLTTLLALLLLSWPAIRCAAQTPILPPAIAGAVNLSDDYKVTPNYTYRSVDGYNARLDVYQHYGKGVRPTLVYIHGGAWAEKRSKEQYSLWFAPFLQLGWNVVNVEYRSVAIAPAPAAVEDCLCALHWVFEHADQHGFDQHQIVVMGHSAGGHLAMMSGMTPADSPLQKCPHGESEHVAAIVNWFGITDVEDLIDGPDHRAWAQAWIGSSSNFSLAHQVSPITYVRADMPPIISIHGDSDPTVPFSQAQRMDSALKKAHVSHELVKIAGGKHGFFGPVSTQQAYVQVFGFLRSHGITLDAGKSQTESDSSTGKTLLANPDSKSGPN